jgi:hypothetical protein
MATAPVYYTDQLVKEYIDKNFAGLTGDALYTAVADEAVKQGVSAEQIGRVLGFNTADVNTYATNIGKPLVAEQKALTDVIDYAYNTQFGRDPTAQEAKEAQYSKAIEKWKKELIEYAVANMKKAENFRTNYRSWSNCLNIDFDLTVLEKDLPKEPEKDFTTLHQHSYNEQKEEISNAIRILKMTDEETVNTSTYNAVARYL